MEMQSLIDSDARDVAATVLESQDEDNDSHVSSCEDDNLENGLLQPFIVQRRRDRDVEAESEIKRRIGLIRAIAMIVGGIIGSGIFISPRFVLKNTGSVGETLIVWTIGGLVSLLGALCYCELGTLIKKSGGDYIYLKITYGRLIGFLFSWTNVWFTNPGGQAIAALTFAVYVTEAFFPTRVAHDYCQPPFGLAKMLAACAICILTGLNCASIHWAAKAQVLFTFCKLMAVIGIIMVALIRLPAGSGSVFHQRAFEGSITNAGNIGHAFYSAMWAYGGWNGLNTLIEEVKNPEKNLVRSLMISVPLVTLCYVFINLAYFSVLSKEEFLSSDAVALTFAIRLNSFLGTTMPFIVALSCFGSLNVDIFASSRIIFSIAREKQLPSCFAMVHRQTQAPIPALLFRAVLSLIMLLPANIENLLNWLSFIDWFIFSAVFIGILILRWKKPDVPRQFRVNIVIPILMALVSLYFAATPFLSNPVESVFGLTIVLAGLPAYYVFILRKWTSKSGRVSQFFSKLSYSIQVIFNVSPLRKL